MNLTIFDTASELAKLARWHPATRALLRIRADDPAARCQLGNKYGADPSDVPALLQVGYLSSKRYIPEEGRHGNKLGLGGPPGGQAFELEGSLMISSSCMSVLKQVYYYYTFLVVRILW